MTKITFNELTDNLSAAFLNEDADINPVMIIEHYTFTERHMEVDVYKVNHDKLGDFTFARGVDEDGFSTGPLYVEGHYSQEDIKSNWADQMDDMPTWG